MIRLTDVTSGVIKIPDLIIKPGRSVITGSNGSGKTTLLELIAGVRIPDIGQIQIEGNYPRESSVGWVCEVPEHNMLFSRVKDEIASPLWFTDTLCDQADQIVADICERIGISDLTNRQIRELSLGERILVALAAALVKRPEILILDETDAHLDDISIHEIDKIISDMKVPYLIFSSHRPDRISCADHLIILEQGSVIFNGDPSDIPSVDSPLFDPLVFDPLIRPDLWRPLYAPTGG